MSGADKPVEVPSNDVALLHGLPVPVVAPTAGDRPQVSDHKRPRGRPVVAEAMLLEAAPWMCMREAPGEVPPAQLVGVTADGVEVSEKHTRRHGWRGEGPEWQGLPWSDADKQRAAHRAVLRIGKAVRRLALRERVPLAEAARHLAEREIAAARSWQCSVGRWIRREVEGAPGARDAGAIHLVCRQRTAAIMKAFAAAAETRAAICAVPFPARWRPKKPRLGNDAAKRTQQSRAALAAVIERALRGAPLPGAKG
jgi:hypothetical protein